ncbi:WXG100 family type VII secretion target [Streptomyces sp. LX-29]|uniref:peptidoglycan-binding protein n=1 Tax=Streptomyces sp. LX-29 TaxID=2900152 RepID=UPI00240CECD4|nr:peptidoglycan-binding protein [Streptomyces sp. LX-29]WFB09124.1 WXG100 family type VII secretion target [Streptomyces sp. LX-29]
MTDKSAKKRFEDIQKDISSLPFGIFGYLKLNAAICKALEVPGPSGNPDFVAGKAKAYRTAADEVETVSTDVEAVYVGALPEVWVGKASEAAQDVIGAAHRLAGRIGPKFLAASKELLLLSEGIREAQSTHEFGVTALHHAHKLLASKSGKAPDEETLTEAHTATNDGLGQLIRAAGQAEEASRRAVRELDKLASDARAVKAGTGDLTDADRLVLADASVPGGDPELNEILSANDLRRASDRMERMNKEDERAFNTLLSQAKSPEERAYLMKSLAAGYSLKEVQEFGKKIHPFGDDPNWLQQHLTPVVNRPGDTKKYGDDSQKVAFNWGGGQAKEWEQKGPTCVASSTVTARAMVDPLYALEITSGGHPGDPKYDNPNAFIERLHDEQERVYDKREGDGEGMTDSESRQVAKEEVSPHIGGSYETRDLENAEDRRNILPAIHSAVDEGKPVPIIVRGPKYGHELVIIGHEGDKLQVYNPWGHTTWVSEDDFINNHMQGASDDTLPNAEAVQLPNAGDPKPKPWWKW